jgi:polyphosphate glucokinase
MLFISSRPRTLVLLISVPEIEAVVLDPTGAAAGERLVLPRTADTPMPVALEALWAALEPLGEFDRVTVGGGRDLGDEWAAPALSRELERQCMRPVRVLDRAELCCAPIIKRTGVELVLWFGAQRLDSSLFFDGVCVPGLALGRHRFRKGRTYSQYLTSRALERKGINAWNKRVTRVVDEVLAVWNPAALYLAGTNAGHITCEVPPTVTIVREPPGLAGALTPYAIQTSTSIVHARAPAVPAGRA